MIERGIIISASHRFTVTCCDRNCGCAWDHDDVEQNHVRFKIVGRLINLGWIVFLQYEIRPGSFQEDFYKVRAVRIIIDDQNPSFSFVY